MCCFALKVEKQEKWLSPKQKIEYYFILKQPEILTQSKNSVCVWLLI